MYVLIRVGLKHTMIKVYIHSFKVGNVSFSQTHLKGNHNEKNERSALTKTQCFLFVCLPKELSCLFLNAGELKSHLSTYSLHTSSSVERNPTLQKLYRKCIFLQKLSALKYQRFWCNRLILKKKILSYKYIYIYIYTGLHAYVQI